MDDTVQEARNAEDKAKKAITDVSEDFKSNIFQKMKMFNSWVKFRPCWISGSYDG